VLVILAKTAINNCNINAFFMAAQVASLHQHSSDHVRSHKPLKVFSCVL
jgi:hypothetical protein